MAKRSTLTSLLLLMILCVPMLRVDAMPLPSADHILDSLADGHPRVMARESDFDRVRRLVDDDPLMALWYRELRKHGIGQLFEPVSTRTLRDGVRLLYESRDALDRAMTMGFLYNLDGDRRWSDRVWRDMEAIAAFPDWNPSHFLDTAEMTAACAFAYDWMYDAWTSEQRETIADAIVRLGLKPALEAYEHGHWWTKTGSNWNQVCNGGISLGALAVADVRPAAAAAALHEALGRLPIAMSNYAPDGGYEEGPVYWTYGTQYNVYLLAALGSALGRDFGLSDSTGFDRTGDFPIQLTGPTGRTFNFGDAGDGKVRNGILFWLADRFNRPWYTEYQQVAATGSVADLLWYDLEDRDAFIEAPPLDSLFERVGVITMRSEWDSPFAAFVGFKAGDNRFSHNHLDLASFVFDAKGQRWAVDLGGDNYNLPGYFDGDRDGGRWDYYRLRAEGHNTVVINPDAGADQDPRAAGEIVLFDSHPDHVAAVVDVSAAYAAEATSVRRGVWFDRESLSIRDEIECNAPSEVWWFMHTAADMSLTEDRRTAILSSNGRWIMARITLPRSATFRVLEAAPRESSPNPDGQAINHGIRKLAIRLEDVEDAVILVHLQPDPGIPPADPPTPPLRRLSDW